MRPLLHIVADVHIWNKRTFPPSSLPPDGINKRARDTLQVLETAARQARKAGATLVVAGDLFDRDKPSPALLAATAEALGTGAVLIVGNHDRTSHAEHALLPLASAGSIVIAEPTIFQGWGGIQMVPAGMEPSGASGVIIAHHGIADEDTPYFMQGSKGAVPIATVRAWMRATGAWLYVSGDWHQHRSWVVAEGSVVQVGALVPQSFSDEGWDYGQVVAVNTERRSWEVTSLPGPRFIADLGRDHSGCNGGWPLYTKTALEAWADVVPVVDSTKSKEHVAVQKAALDIADRSVMVDVVGAVLEAEEDDDIKELALQLIDEENLL